MAASDSKHASSARGGRALILTVLIVAVTFFWVLMLVQGGLPGWALAGIAVLSLVVLAVATAWTAMAFPGRSTR